LAFSQAKLDRVAAWPGRACSSSVTAMPASASRAATHTPSTPAPITAHLPGPRIMGRRSPAPAGSPPGPRAPSRHRGGPCTDKFRHASSPAQQVTGQGRHAELRQDAVLPPALGQLTALQQVLGDGGGVAERRPRVSHGRGGG
jgi:hypothetical protein